MRINLHSIIVSVSLVIATAAEYLDTKHLPETFLQFGPLCEQEDYSKCHLAARRNFEKCSQANAACRCYYIGVTVAECVKLCSNYNHETFYMLKHLCDTNPYLLNINAGANISDVDIDYDSIKSDIFDDDELENGEINELSITKRDFQINAVSGYESGFDESTDENTQFSPSDLQWERNSLNPEDYTNDGSKDSEFYKTLSQKNLQDFESDSEVLFATFSEKNNYIIEENEIGGSKGNENENDAKVTEKSGKAGRRKKYNVSEHFLGFDGVDSSNDPYDTQTSGTGTILDHNIIYATTFAILIPIIMVYFSFFQN